MSWQASWAPTTTLLRTRGRPDEVLEAPTAVAKVHRVSRFAGVSVFTTPPVSGAFVHPGVLVGPQQLDFVKAKLAAGLNPWQDAYNRMLLQRCDYGATCVNNNREFASLSWVPAPRSQIGRGSSGGNSEGDTDMMADGIAAYVHALIWFYTGNRAHANKAVQILNAWAQTLTFIKFDTTNYADGLLLAGWSGGMMPRGAEIMRYTFTPTGGEAALDVTNLIRIFRDVYIPRVRDGWVGGAGNWLQSMAEAHMHCAVFNDSVVEFNAALANYRGWTPGSFYLTGDVNRWPVLAAAGMPLSPTGTMYDRNTTTVTQMRSYWRNPTSFTNGLQQETGRDPWHSAMAFSGAINACETARLHGVDLYGEFQTRLVTAIELNSRYLVSVYLDSTNPPVGWPFAANMQFSNTNTQRTTWDIAYNHYHSRLGIAMPYTDELLVNYVRTTNFRASAAGQIAYETLTHYGAP